MRRPNVLVFLADDMGYGDLGVLGDGTPQTPALDRLVSEGLLLTQHYSGAPVCAPARAALLTGRYAHRTGAVDTLEARGLDRLALRETTMADLFRAAGYATGLIGKWHLGALDPRYHPTARGFDEFVGFRGGWSDYYRWRLDWGGSFRSGDGRYLTDVFADAAIDFLRRHRNEPFLLHVHFNAPHFPFQAPEEEVRRFRETGRLNTGLSVLYAMIARLDLAVGRILEELDRLGLREATIVLFTSDNGPQFSGEGDQSIHRYNGGFRGSKGQVFEGGIRVPAIVRWPGGLPQGRRIDGMVHFLDWLPTLCVLAGIPANPPLPLDGRDATPILRGEAGGVDPVRFWQWNRYTPVGTCNAAVRDGRWKLVRPAIREAMRLDPADAEMDRRIKYEPEAFIDIRRDPEPARELPEPPPPLLFDLATDPWEQHDLAAAEPERTARLLRALEDWFAEVDAERRAAR
jgi:arylsulfatase A-like enzyme